MMAHFHFDSIEFSTPSNTQYVLYKQHTLYIDRKSRAVSNVCKRKMLWQIVAKHHISGEGVQKSFNQTGFKFNKILTCSCLTPPCISLSLAFWNSLKLCVGFKENSKIYFFLLKSKMRSCGNRT